MSTVSSNEMAFACASDTGYQSGMSLRDYFAAKAMQAFIGLEGGVNPTQGKDIDWKAATARVSYEVADAMLEARKK